MSSGQCLFDPNYNGYTHYFSSLQKWSRTYFSFHIANFHNTKLHPYSSFYMEERQMYSKWFCTIILFNKQYFPVTKLWNTFFLCPLGMKQFSQQPDHKNYYQEMGGNCLPQKQKNRIANAPSKKNQTWLLQANGVWVNRTSIYALDN